MQNSIINELRALAPDRRLGHFEARSVAERQASRLLALTGIDRPSVPSSIISDLPRIDVHLSDDLDASGRSGWIRGRWLIELNAVDHPRRRRFSLAHELKHVLDHTSVDRLYGPLTTPAARRRAEQLCDYFAACLLMPRIWVKQAWVAGIQDTTELAQFFDVSTAAMRVRLSQLGLTAPSGRSSTLIDRQQRRTQQTRRRPPQRSTANAASTPIGLMNPPTNDRWCAGRQTPTTEGMVV